MPDRTCPHCGNQLVRPFGRPKSTFLLIGEAPSYNEVIQGQCFAGPAGDVLKAELQRAGIAYSACRATHLWLHAIPKEKKGSEIKKLCFDYCFEQLLEQIRTARAILLMGAELATLMTGKSITRINGAKVTSPYINPETIVVAAYNPAIVLQESGVVGDFRMAIEHFFSYTKDMYKEMLYAR